MDPRDEMTEQMFNEMMAAREGAWTIKEFRLDVRGSVELDDEE